MAYIAEENKNIVFDAIKISLASPDKIREWSNGEVSNFKT